MPETIFVIGHKSPDLDSVTAAINYANLKNQIENSDRYQAAIAGEINKVTEFILDRFSVQKPAILDDASGKSLILVDHNEFTQAAQGIETARITEILDHHKLNFSYPEPIRADIWPLGSSNSIIFQKYIESGIDIDAKTASLMLAAILDDTVITKSPTCTEIDKDIIETLAGMTGIEDWKGFGIEMFKAKSAFGKMSEIEIIKSDFKDFSMKSGKIGIGQVETVDLGDFTDRVPAIIKELDLMRSGGEYHTTALFITDIINEGSLFLVSSGNTSEIGQAFAAKIEANSAYLPGIISRKKQIIPKFSEALDK